MQLSKVQLQRCRQCCQDIRLLCGVDCRTVSTRDIQILRDTPPLPDFCDECSYIRCRARATHAYGCNESYRWHSPYLYYCPLGLAFVAQCICSEAGELEGGITAGPFLTNDREDAQEQVAELLQVHQTTYSDYELGRVNIPVSALCRLAEFYGTSIDYLVGLTDERRADPRRKA